MDNRQEAAALNSITLGYYDEMRSDGAPVDLLFSVSFCFHTHFFRCVDVEYSLVVQ